MYNKDNNASILHIARIYKYRPSRMYNKLSQNIDIEMFTASAVHFFSETLQNSTQQLPTVLCIRVISLVYSLLLLVNIKFIRPQGKN